ncbi:MAG: hypothetical protein ACK4FZ_01830 [Vogesella sp.]|uniref:hypothetical protein n=1 Tax=Vogesella sp. TaxID=1904252 RepID=UPI003918804E
MWQQRWQAWQENRPRLHRDGVSLPGKLVLRKLQQWLNNERLSIDDLLLDEHGAVFWLTLHHPAHTILQLHCQPAAGGPDGALHLHYQIKGDPAQAGLRGHALAKLATLASGSGVAANLLQRLTADIAWLQVSPHHITLYWRNIPALQDWLQRTRLATLACDQLDIGAVLTTEDALRLRLTRRQPANQG